MKLEIPKAFEMNPDTLSTSDGIIILLDLPTTSPNSSIYLVATCI